MSAIGDETAATTIPSSNGISAGANGDCTVGVSGACVCGVSFGDGNVPKHVALVLNLILFIPLAVPHQDVVKTVVMRDVVVDVEMLTTLLIVLMLLVQLSQRPFWC